MPATVARKQKLESLLKPSEAAAFLGVNVGTLDVWRSTGRYRIPYIKFGRSVRYRQSDLQKFVAEKTVGE